VSDRSLRPGEILAAAAGVALLAVMFLEWYAADGEAVSAWEAFSVTDVVLALVALLAIALAALNVSGRGPAVPVAVAVVTVTLTFVALLLLLYRILNQPGPNDLVEVRAGAWLGLAALAALFAGAWWSIGDSRPRPVDPPAPEPERRPAPSHS
jgi:cytochrome bd-type quinol oxidase subunit 2